MNLKEYSCDKCGVKTYKSGELRTTGSGVSRFFNLQNQKYRTIACTECGFTERTAEAKSETSWTSSRIRRRDLRVAPLRQEAQVVGSNCDV